MTGLEHAINDALVIQDPHHVMDVEDIAKAVREYMLSSERVKLVAKKLCKDASDQWHLGKDFWTNQTIEAIKLSLGEPNEPNSDKVITDAFQSRSADGKSPTNGGSFKQALKEFKGEPNE